MKFPGSGALWENAKHFSPSRATRPSCPNMVIALAIFAQLCLTQVNANRCKVDAQKFVSLDNATCLPRDHRDIGNGNVPCSTAVTVLFSCHCKDRIGRPGRNSVKHPSYCLLQPAKRTGDYTASLKLGVCTRGLCESRTFRTTLAVDLRDVVTAERLKLPPLPACTRKEFNVNNSFRPLTSCAYFCKNTSNKTVNDGSPCVLKWSRSVFGRLRVALTGQCWNGICKHPEPLESPTGLGCMDKELLASQTGIVSECTFRCGRKAKKRGNGVTCLIRKATAFRSAVIGVCFRGRCMKIVEVKNEPLGFTETEVRVGARCTYVANNRLTQRREGALCVHARSWFRRAPQLLGYCSQGNCKSMRPFRPPTQVFKHKDCKVRDVKLTKRFYVAESCTATCRNYKTEPRYDGIPCLLQYRSFRCYVFRTCSAYTIGQCYKGRCIRTSRSWDMHI
ncbi:uncharacterized protein LOC144146007 isoform X1 [Haemaphysalis longicornis]